MSSDSLPFGIRASLKNTTPAAESVPQKAMASPSDSDLITLVQRGSEEAFGQLFDRYYVAVRERPIIGDRRTPSPLGDIQPKQWLAGYTTELINVLNVLGWLVTLEPTQAELLDKICSGPTISGDELHNAGALEVPAKPKKGKKLPAGPDLFSHAES